MKSLNTARADAAPKEWAVLRTSTTDPIGGELKTMFGALTAGPMPDRMMQLADALEEAFHRGDLFDVKPRRMS